MKPAIRFQFIFIATVLTCQVSWGQANRNNTTAQAANPNGYFDLGIKTGSFLPYDIQGVRELLPMWGIKMGHDVSRTLSLEYDLDIAHAKGVRYFLAYFSLRHDFLVGDVLPLFFTLGVDGHYYKRVDTYGEITGNLTEYDYQFSSGWHMGFGTETTVYGDLLFRTDFRMGFSPGRQLVVSIAGVYRW